MGLRWWVTVATAFCLLSLIAYSDQSPVTGASSDDVVASCANASGNEVTIIFKLGQRSVSFENGPNLKITAITHRPDGTIDVRASSDVYEMLAMIGAAAIIRFRHVPETFDKLVCSNVRRTSRPSDSR